MSWQRSYYQQIEHLIHPGDVIAFSGSAIQSDLVRKLTSSNISHVGIVLSSKNISLNGFDAGDYNHLIESTNLEGFTGVVVNKLCERIADYNGDIWWLPLSEDSRAKADIARMFDFLSQQKGKEYDYAQAVMSAMDYGKITQNKEDFTKLFCSELVCAGLKEAGVLSVDNASEVTPIDVCRFNIFADNYYQLKGEKKEFEGYNQTNPEEFIGY